MFLGDAEDQKRLAESVSRYYPENVPGFKDFTFASVQDRCPWKRKGKSRSFLQYAMHSQPSDQTLGFIHTIPSYVITSTQDNTRIGRHRIRIR